MPILSSRPESRSIGPPPRPPSQRPRPTSWLPSPPRTRSGSTRRRWTCAGSAVSSSACMWRTPRVPWSSSRLRNPRPGSSHRSSTRHTWPGSPMWQWLPRHQRVDMKMVLAILLPITVNIRLLLLMDKMVSTDGATAKKRVKGNVAKFIQPEMVTTPPETRHRSKPPPKPKVAEQLVELASSIPSVQNVQPLPIEVQLCRGAKRRGTAHRMVQGCPLPVLDAHGPQPWHSGSLQGARQAPQADLLLQCNHWTPRPSRERSSDPKAMNC